MEEPPQYMTPAAELVALRQEVARAEARAVKADARVKELQAELAEQEVDKLRLVKELGWTKQELAVEKAKTALLWPVATKQTPSHDSE